MSRLRNQLPLMTRLQNKCEQLEIKISVEDDYILLNDVRYYDVERGKALVDQDLDVIPIQEPSKGEWIFLGLLQFVTYIEHNKYL